MWKKCEVGLEHCNRNDWNNPIAPLCNLSDFLVKSAFHTVDQHSFTHAVVRSGVSGTGKIFAGSSARWEEASAESRAEDVSLIYGGGISFPL